MPSRSTQPDQCISQEKFQIVLETAPVNEAEVSAYCRERGLYPEQVEAWQDARMNASDDAFAESAFKTLKYRPDFPVDGFATLAEAQEWIQEFTEWYNHEHRLSVLRYVTPGQRHSGEAEETLTQRREVFEATKQRHPERWSGRI
ncbi:MULTISPECIES: integrase core domain-containing protein [unclassified Halomonas]|uniref:integrase core domain-containing protein n=1 Tax=unclassified Halomonas TaxID=2609666 RepID=UPI0028860379|nr:MULTISPECIES: integrase core domain-containing protein [unclassified Halomonas]MDT0502585.1 integrase core domain-containing protein [Halomonas sp. PAR7]MDT0511703.1 integrase core domain-containing protein [Halomonas sp. LES1]MDT0592036.1 integrase core domain-containing protein [Halomonas sp. PAR8]